MQLEALTEAIDGLMQCDPATFGDAASMEVVHREVARLESWATSATAAFDASGAWGEDGARHAPAWVSARCRMARPKARRLVRRGRALRHLPACAEAWSEGAVSGDHVDVLAALRREATLALLERDEAMLVEEARVLSFEDFVRLVAYWEQRADPDGIEADAEERRTRRDVYLVDHIIPYAKGGPTTQENGGLLCRFHNRLRSQRRNQRPPPDG